MPISPAVAKLLQPDETAYDMLRRSGAAALKGHFPSTGFADLDDLLQRVQQALARELPQACHVLEIEGEPGTGKSFLMMSLAARIAEAGGGVWYFDLDKRLSVSRFARFFQSEEHLSRVSVVRPDTSKEFLAALHLIGLSKVPVRMVVIDSLLAFYQMNILTDPLGAGYFFSIPHVLLELASRQGFVVVASKPAVSFEIVSKTWLQGVSYRLVLTGPGQGVLKVPALARASVVGQPLQDGTVGGINFAITG